MSAAPASNEYELGTAPSDGITSLNFQDNRYLLCTSWDTKVRVYDILGKGEKASYSHKAAVLDGCFVGKGLVATGGIDKVLKLVDLESGTEREIGTHDKAIKCVKFDANQGLHITGSWDSTVKLWDVRSSTPCVATLKLPERVYTMGHSGDKLVVGTAGRNISIYTLKSWDVPLQTRESSLKFQTRAISCFSEGFAIGSIEGKVAIEYFDLSPEIQAKKYAFKCHRVPGIGHEIVYPVNVITFHPIYGTFATGGCDGTVNIWDGFNRKRLAQLRKYPTSVAAIAFSENGNQMAIASSYTYEEGEKDHPNEQIFIRTVTDLEVKPKQLATK